MKYLKNYKKSQAAWHLICLLVTFSLLSLSIINLTVPKATAQLVNPITPGLPGGNSSGPKRSECDKKPQANKCKKDFDRCNIGPTTLQRTKACKQAVLSRPYNNPGGGNQNPGGGGGSGGGGGGSQQPAAATSGGGGGGGSDESKAKAPPKGELDFGAKGTHQCGNLANDKDNFKTKINFGCLGKKGPAGLGPIQDLLFALIRFLSMGVGIAITLALIASGVQYTMAEGNADATQKAKKRMQTAIIGLAIFIFAWSALQFLIPGGLFRPGVWLLL